MNIPLQQYWQILGGYLKPQRGRVVLLALLLFLSIGFELVNPQILRYFIDTAQRRGAPAALTEAALLFLVVAFGTQGVTVAETYVAENLGWTATNRMRADLALHCLHLDPSFHSAYTPGALIERVDGDVAALGNFFARFVVQILGNALLLVGVLILLFAVDWRAGAGLTVFALVSLAAASTLRGMATPRWAAARQSSADLFGLIEEQLSGTEDIRSSGAVPYVMRRLHERSRDLLYKELKASAFGAIAGGTSFFLFALGTAVAVAMGAYLYTSHAVTIGTVFLIFSYTQLLGRPIDALIRQFEDLQRAAAGISRISELFALHSVITDGRGGRLPRGSLEVQFRDVTFGYVPEEPVLHDITFHLRPGTVLGLLGRTGSGKSTLTRLLFRLYDPQKGSVMLGGMDLRDGQVADLRGRVGMVTQDIQIFHATVRDNLTLFDHTVSDDRIISALHQVGMGEWYATLPQGLATKLAPGGSGLSAGEAQLLAFTRVFLQDPDVVILDEASSRLDPATERRLEQAIDRLLHNRTAIIIAHRLATVERADDIMILEGGHIREYGPRAGLAGDRTSRFAELLRAGMEEALA